MLTAVSLVCLIASAYLIYNTTATAAVQRGLVMASLRLFGGDAHRLFGLLMLEALVLGLAGVAAGIPAGIALARLLVHHVANSMGVIFQLRFPVHALSVPLASQAVIAALGVATALAGSFVAARRLARLEPLAVVRDRDVRALAAETSSARLVLWWLGLMAVSLAALAVQVRLRSSAWGNFSAMLWYASTVVIAVPLVRRLAPSAARLLRALFGPVGAFAGESLLRTPTRSGVTIAAIALVLTTGITFTALVASCERSIAGYFLGGSLTADLAVSAVTTEGGWLETPLPDTVEHELRALPGVGAVETLRILPGQLYRGERIALAACSDALTEPGRFPPGWFRAGDARSAHPAIVAGDGCLISTQLADRFDLEVGGSIDLDSPAGVVALRIAGVVPDYISDRGALIVNRRLLAAHWNDTSANRLLLWLAEGATPAEVRRGIATHFAGRHALKVASMSEVVADHSRHVRRAFALLDSIQLLIAIVTIAGVFDLLLSAILERRREIALWQLVGATPRTVRRAILVESVTLGCGAAALGIAVGGVTAWLWVRFNFRHLLGYAFEFHLDEWRVLWLVALTLAMTALAGWAAAAWALRRPVLAGLRAD